MSIIDNVVPYTHAAAAWSDKHSNVAFHWNEERKSGLQCLQVIVGWGGSIITDKCLDWNLYEKGNLLDKQNMKRIFRPDKIIETIDYEGIDFSAVCAYPLRNAVAVEFTVTNRTASKRSLSLLFEHPGKDVKPDWEGPFPVGHIVSVEGESEGSWTTLFTHKEHGINYGWVGSFVAGMPDQASIELTCLADFNSVELEMEAGECVKHCIFMAFGYKRSDVRCTYREAAELIQSGWTPLNATKQFENFVQKLPPIASRYKEDNSLEKMYLHAASQLNSLFIKGEGGYTDFYRIPYTQKHGLAIAFFWDTAFSIMGALHYDPHMCQEAIEAFVNNVGPRGSMPGTVSDSHRAGEGQAPVMSRAAWQVFEKTNDLEWLGRVYGTLAGYIHFWYTYHSSSRGLAKYYNAGQIADNDARFDGLYGEERTNEPVDLIESPDLSAFMVVEMRSLAQMANALDKQQESEEWENQASQLSKDIVDIFYFPEDAMFYDVKEGTKEMFSGVITPNMFLPLWAEVPLPEHEKRRIVEMHMLNPDEFYRELPFPSLAYNHPKYEPNSYWRGRIWPHIVYLMIETLWKAGYHEEAEITADRLLEMFKKSPWIHECYESANGEGFDPKTGMGGPDYNWSLATAINILLETYKTEE